MDEAFSALNPLIRAEMQDELLKLQNEHQRTIVFISHDLDEAIRIADRIAIMPNGEISQIGTPEEIINNPANDYIKDFAYLIGKDNLYIGTLSVVALRNDGSIDDALIDNDTILETTSISDFIGIVASSKYPVAVVDEIRDFFQLTKVPIETTLLGIQDFLLYLSPFVIIIFFTLLAWQVSSKELAVGRLISFY